eukprot:9472051-Pyramimonas_sp.AAC.3
MHSPLEAFAVTLPSDRLHGSEEIQNHPALPPIETQWLATGKIDEASRVTATRNITTAVHLGSPAAARSALRRRASPCPAPES